MFIGVDGVIVNKTNACGLTPAVCKVSSGALEFIPLYSVKFVKKFLEDAVLSHHFKIISTNINEEDKVVQPSSQNNEEEEEMSTKKKSTKAEKKDDDLESNKKIPPIISLNDLQINKKDNLLLVLGSEGEGVSRTIESFASQRLTIPPQLQMSKIGKHPFNMIDSLNVGVSAALLIHQINNKRQFSTNSKQKFITEVELKQINHILEYWFPPSDWDRQSTVSSQANKRYWAGGKEVDEYMKLNFEQILQKI